MRILIDCRAFIRSGSSASAYTYNLVNNLIRKSNHHFVLVLNSKSYIEYFKNITNVDVIYSCVNNNIIWDNFVIPYYALKEKVDLIFYTKSSSCWFKIPKKKIVTTIHGMIYKVQPENHTLVENLYWKMVGKISYRIANAIVAVSSSDKKDLIACNYSSKHIYVIPIGVSDSFFSEENYEDNSILDEYNLAKCKYFIQVGHITKKKNQKFTISLFYDVLKRYPDFKLVFIGSTNRDADYYSKIVDYISDLGIVENIVFTGVIDQNLNPKTIPTLLGNSICAFFPSTYEGFGMPAIEAIAAGTPALVSDRGSLPEVLGKENVIPLEQSEKWVSEINKLIEDKNYKDFLISKQETIIYKYKWDNITNEYLKLFDSIVGIQT